MTPRKIGQHHGDLKRSLIESTLDLLEQGEPSPSLRQVARHAGVSSGAPYHHFGDRAGLLSAVAAQGFEQLARAQREALHPDLDIYARLDALIKAYVCFCVDHSAHYRTMFDPAIGDHDEELDAKARACFELLVHAIAGVRPDLDEPRLLRCARQSWAIAHGAVLLGLDDLLSRLHGPSTPDAIAAEVSEAVLRLARSA